MIAFLCSGCGKSLKVKDEFAGRKGNCPHCKQPMMVPSVADAARERAAQAGHDNYSETDAKTILPPSLDGERDPKTILPAVPRGNTGLKKGNTIIPDVAAANGNAELYDFLAPPQAADEIGRLGSYRVLKVLGAGGMGVVFQAEDPKLNRLVALKAMLPALAASGSNKERFIREARAAAAIEHDHIIPIFQVDEERGVPFIAMPFLRGEALEDRLKKQRRLPLVEALRIAKETANGLAAAHDRNMIHRDIKPANVWLEGEKGRVKILDFGLARSARGESNLTQQGAIIGTPAYMAPEQGAGKEVDTRCDLFSLGCMLYRMVTGQMPFKGADTVSTLVAVATETPKAPRKLNPEISPKLSKLIMDLLAKDPKDRPPSAHSVVELIEELEKEPPQDVTERVNEPLARVSGIRRNDDYDTLRGDALEEEELEEQPAKRSLLMPLLIGGGVGLFALLLIGVIGAFVYFKKDTPEVTQNNPPPVENNVVKPPVIPNTQVLQPRRTDGNTGGNVNPGENDPQRGNLNPGIRRKPRPKRGEAREADEKFNQYGSAVRGLVFAPDGKHFFSHAENNAQLEYWDLAAGKVLRSFPLAGTVRHCVVSADGAHVLAYNSNQLAAWDTDGGGKPQTVTPLPGQKIVGGGFTDDGNFHVALASQVQVGNGFPRQTSGIVHIYDNASKKFLMVDPSAKKPVPLPIGPHGGEVLRVWFNPDCKRAISWCNDRVFRSWDLEAKQPLATFTVAPKLSKSIDVSHDFKRVLGTFHEASVRVYDADAGTQLKEIKTQDFGDVDAVAVGPDGVGVAGGWGGITRVLDLESGKIKKELSAGKETFGRNVTAIAVSADGKSVLSGDNGGTIYLHHLDEEK